jgi:hypothetical protein
MAQSFSLANVVPQNIQHNSGAWAKIEHDTRHYALRAQGDVYVITGPVFTHETERTAPHAVKVPTYLYKLVYDATTAPGLIGRPTAKGSACRGRSAMRSWFSVRGLSSCPAGQTEHCGCMQVGASPGEFRPCSAMSRGMSVQLTGLSNPEIRRELRRKLQQCAAD